MIFTAQIGDFVKIHFTGRLDDGRVFATSKKSKPVSFRLGKGEVISGLENAVVGMSPGQSKSIAIPPEDAFGCYRGDGLVVVDRSNFPKHIELNKGQLLRVRKSDGKTGMVRVALVGDTRVMLDTNHVLAGKTITMDIELLECSPPSEASSRVFDVDKQELNLNTDKIGTRSQRAQKGQ
jgi:peptidylprolyl isomerase